MVRWRSSLSLSHEEGNCFFCSKLFWWWWLKIDFGYGDSCLSLLPQFFVCWLWQACQPIMNSNTPTRRPPIRNWSGAVCLRIAKRHASSSLYSPLSQLNQSVIPNYLNLSLFSVYCCEHSSTPLFRSIFSLFLVSLSSTPLFLSPLDSLIKLSLLMRLSILIPLRSLSYPLSCGTFCLFLFDLSLESLSPHYACGTFSLYSEFYSLSFSIYIL